MIVMNTVIKMIMTATMSMTRNITTTAVMKRTVK